MNKKTSTSKSKKSTMTCVDELFHGVTFRDLLIPLSVIAGALIIGGSILSLVKYSEPTPTSIDYEEYMQQQHVANMKDGAQDSVKKNSVTNSNAKKVLPVTKLDHIKGEKDAQVMVVEYSDLDCPFCARVHDTLEKVVEEYDGKVAWVYRHFPLESIHPNAKRMSEASECVAQVGGKSAFWDFVDGYFDKELKKDLSNVEEVTGVALDAVETCLEEGTFASRIEAQIQNAKDTGGKGTPWSVLIGPNGQYATVKGAQPLSVWKTEIDKLLN